MSILEKTCYLVEEMLPGVCYDKGEVIALTPEACYSLDREHISYSIPENFFNEEELRHESGIYFLEQIKWFQDFDGLLKEGITHCRIKDLNLAQAYYNRFKYWMDTVIFYSHIFNNILRRVKPANVVYVGYREEKINSSSLYDLFLTGYSIPAQLIGVICKKYDNLKFSMLASLKNDDRAETGRPERAAKEMLKFFHAKDLADFIRFKKYKIFLKNQVLTRINALVLHAGSASIDHVINTLLSSGARAFTISADSIMEQGIFNNRVVVNTKNSDDAFSRKIEKDCKAAAQKLSNDNPLVRWITEKCASDTSEYVLAYMKYFISHICADNISRIEKIQPFLNAEKINMVIARASTDYDAITALSATGDASGIKRVCFQHSSTAVNCPALLMTDTRFFDYSVAQEGLSEDYFKKNKLNTFKNCTLLQSPHYFRLLQRKYAGMPIHANSEDRIIMFAPTDTIIGYYNFNNEFFTGPSYYMFLKAIIDYFSKKKDKTFIFKYVKGSCWAFNSIVAYINGNKFDNIKLEDKPLSQCFKAADRVIFDHPSTGFFESISVGMPTLSLYKNTLIPSEYATRTLGKLLQPISGAKDAIEKIEQFLLDDPEEYRGRIPMTDDDTQKILRSILNNPSSR